VYQAGGGKGIQTDAVYTDFSRAFDRIDHFDSFGEFEELRYSIYLN
jgi:hypothetical protein